MPKSRLPHPPQFRQQLQSTSSGRTLPCYHWNFWRILSSERWS